MQFQIDPQPMESLRGCQALVAASLPPDRSSLISFGVYAAVAVAAFILTPSTTIPTLGIAVGALVILIYASQAYSRARISRLMSADPYATETHFVEVDATGVRAWCSHVDSCYTWQDFAKVTEDREFYLLVRPAGNGTAIPKRLLDATQDSELRARLKEWSPDAGAHLAQTVHGHR